jgi:hypothetical protein
MIFFYMHMKKYLLSNCILNSKRLNKLMVIVFLKYSILHNINYSSFDDIEIVIKVM